MKVAVIQHDIVWCDRLANFAHLESMIGEASSNGAEIILLSETFSTGFAVEDAAFAEMQDGASSMFLRDMATKYNLWIGGTCPEISPELTTDTRPANVFVVAGPELQVHRYHKIHPFTFGGEDKHVRPGAHLVTINIAGLRVSLFVCYDLRFGDEFWQLAQDTDMYLVPGNWPESRREHWSTLLRARAIENQAYVVGCNRVGHGGGLTYGGQSMIVDPFGEVLACAGSDEIILYGDVTPERVAEIRHKFPFLQDRRPQG